MFMPVNKLINSPMLIIKNKWVRSYLIICKSMNWSTCGSNYKSRCEVVIDTKETSLRMDLTLRVTLSCGAGLLWRTISEKTPLCLFRQQQHSQLASVTRKTKHGQNVLQLMTESSKYGRRKLFTGCMEYVFEGHKRHTKQMLGVFSHKPNTHTCSNSVSNVTRQVRT